MLLDSMTKRTQGSKSNWNSGDFMAENSCAVCGKSYNVRPSSQKVSKYCSKACMSEGYKSSLKGDSNPNYKNAASRVCIHCERVFSSYNKGRKYCSQNCYWATKRLEIAARPIIAPVAHPRLRNPDKYCLYCNRPFHT